MSHQLLYLTILFQACLVFSQTPSITTDPQSQTILQHGTSATLTCSASLATSYTWRKDGVALSDSSIFTILSGMLTITSFNPAQEGEYMCLASNSGFTVTSAIANMRASTFSIASETGPAVMADMNGAAQIPCGPVTALPKSMVNYAWEYLKFGAFLTVTSNSPNQPVVGDNGTLYITHAAETTLYRCTASFGTLYSPLTHFVNLNVSDTVASPPVSTVLFGPSDLTVNQGDNAVLECIGVVGSSVSWSYPASVPANQVIDAGSKLNLFQVDSSFEGTYTCTAEITDATAGSSTAILSIVVPPTMTTTLGATTAVNFGTLLTLQCTASGRGITWRWYHNGEPITSTDTPSDTESSSTYSVPATAKSHAVAYQCFAYNSAGNAKDATTVSINIVPPTITTPLVEDVAFFGSSITMLCAASGFPPPTFTWFKEGVSITGKGGPDGVLTLDNVDSLFPGTYTCTATSMIPGDPQVIPMASSSADIFAAAPTVFTTILPGSLTVSRGNGFTLQCAVTHSPDTTVVLTWFKDNVALTNGGNISFTTCTSSYVTSLSLELIILQSTLADGGTYSCSALTTYTGGGKTLPTTPISPISTAVTITDQMEPINSSSATINPSTTINSGSMSTLVSSTVSTVSYVQDRAIIITTAVSSVLAVMLVLALAVIVILIIVIVLIWRKQSRLHIHVANPIYLNNRMIHGEIAEEQADVVLQQSTAYPQQQQNLLNSVGDDHTKSHVYDYIGVQEEQAGNIVSQQNNSQFSEPQVQFHHNVSYNISRSQDQRSRTGVHERRN